MARTPFRFIAGRIAGGCPVPLEFAPAQHQTERMMIHALWMTAALSCDGDSFSMTAATSPSIEDLVQGIVPGMPRLLLHHPLLAYENGHDFLSAWFDAAAGRMEPFILIVEGSIPNEALSGEGFWAGLGADPETGQPIPTTSWIDRLASKAAAVVAVGTCATYGGVPAMRNNPTGAMGLPDYLGWGWTSREGIPIVCIPGCPAQPDNITETILYLTLMLAGRAPQIELDEALRPKWLFNRTVHESCNRAAYYEQGDFAREYGSSKCMVKLGCKGPVVRCNVGVRGWVRGRGGCPNVGGICIGCTMPGFPDKFLPFMSSAAPARVSANVARFTYGPLLRMMRRHLISQGSLTPPCRRPEQMEEAYRPRWDAVPPAPKLPMEAYQAGNRLGRRYELGPQDLAWLEWHESGVLVGWTTHLGALGWLEALHDLAGVSGNALGLVIANNGLETWGDLTWRETRALVEDSAIDPELVKVDLGTVSLLWKREDPAEGSLCEVGLSAPSLEDARVPGLMVATATAAIAVKAGAILRDAGRSWHTAAEGL